MCWWILTTSEIQLGSPGSKHVDLVAEPGVCRTKVYLQQAHHDAVDMDRSALSGGIHLLPGRVEVREEEDVEIDPRRPRRIPPLSATSQSAYPAEIDEAVEVR